MATIYDDEYLKTGQDKIVALLNTLKTTMASGYDPTFSYVYEGHSVANLQLNAVTVDVEGENDDTLGWSNAVQVEHLVDYSIRVHTAWTGGIQDGMKNARLLTSITNKLRDNLDLSDNFRIIEIGDREFRENFADSDTNGGEVTITVRAVVAHTQE